MKEIISIDLYYRLDKESPREQESATPISQDIRAIKLQIGKMIEAIPYESGSYYVVVGAMRNDGKVGYRTIIPKTVI